MIDLEGNVRRYGHFPESVSDALRPFFDDDWILLTAVVRVQIRPADWWLFRASGRGHPTPAFVWGRTIYFAEGVLNYPFGPVFERWQNHFDLTTPAGWGTLAHEIKHVEQNVASGWWGMLGRYVGGVFRSLRHGSLWDHKRIPFEQEAIDFEKRVRETLKAEKPDSWFEQWRSTS